MSHAGEQELALEIEDILFQSAGTAELASPCVRYIEFPVYQAKSWTTPRRIVAKVEHHRGELFPRVGFDRGPTMVLPSRSVDAVLQQARHGGAMDQRRQAVATHWTRLSCHRFRANEVTPATECPGLQPGQPLAQTQSCRRRVKRWSLTSLQQRLVKTGGSAGEACQATTVLLLAEGHLTRRLFERHVAEDLGAAGCSGG